MPSSDPASSASSDDPSSESDSDAPLAAAGEEDGAAGLPAGPYQTLVAQSVARSRIGDELDALNARLERVDASIEEVRSLRAEIAATETEIEQMTDRRASLREDLDDAETNREAVEEEQHAKSSRGSVIYAGLYTIAGLFFVAGDVIMSREIVANALKLRGDVEPWIFAIGLGMLAVLLKPAYDRLVEKRWWKGRERAFGVVISVCAVGVVGTLWVLGAFRSTAFVANAKIQRLTAELMETSDPARIQEIQQQVTTLQEGLMESPLGYWAFVFSGILFAVAGAVCLGIGIRHLRDAYHLRYRLYRARRRIEQRVDRCRSDLEDLSDQLPEARVRLQRLRQQLADRPSLDALRDRRSKLRAARRELRDRRADLESLRRQAEYRRGHDRGRHRQTARSADAPPSSENGSSGSMAPARTDTGSDAEASSSYVDLRRYLQRDEASNGHRDRFNSRET
jgi:predicted  nucleic acid-binding Zn-ribbon protein